MVSEAVTTAPNPTITLTKTALINGQSYAIVPGETILSFVRRYKGKDYVPTLCDAPNLEPFGSCRVCSVEVGMRNEGLGTNGTSNGSSLIPHPSKRSPLAIPRYRRA